MIRLPAHRLVTIMLADGRLGTHGHNHVGRRRMVANGHGDRVPRPSERGRRRYFGTVSLRPIDHSRIADH
jgi:hypothetical protein